MDVSVKQRHQLSFDVGNRLGLTVEATPAGDVAGFVVREHEIGFRQTGSHDFVREADGRLQLDQGDVVTAGESRVRLGVDLRGAFMRGCLFTG